MPHKGGKFSKGYLTPKGRPLRDDHRKIDKLRRKARGDARKARNRRRVSNIATKVLGGRVDK